MQQGDVGPIDFDNSRSESMEVRRRERTRGKEHCFRDSSHCYEREYDAVGGRKRSRCEVPRRIPRTSELDDGRLEWQDTRGDSSRRYGPIFLGASSDARLVFPCLGDHSTPHSASSPWDSVAPSPTPIRASRSSVRSSSPKYVAESNLIIMSSAKSSLCTDQNQEILESMRLEMEYYSDRAWYDREEGTTLFAGDFLGDEASFQKKEVDLTKNLVHRDGRKMPLAQSTRLSQFTSDNAQWEDRQLLRSGAVRDTELQQTDFDDDEEERKVILHVHDTKAPLLDGRIVFTKQVEPIMPIKDPTSDMAVISRKNKTCICLVKDFGS